MKKTFILDANVLLSDPNSCFKFDDNDVIIPISVIEEIDRFKKDLSEIGRNAREISRILDKLREKGALSSGITLFDDRDDSGKLFVSLGHNTSRLPGILDDNTDNHILAVGLNLQTQKKDTRVIIVTKDTNLRIKADALGIEAQDFEADKIAIQDISYTGIVNLEVSSSVINNFYKRQEISIEELNPEVTINPNEFVVLKDISNSSQFVYGIYDATDRIVRGIGTQADGVWGIYPRNLEQTFALEALLDDNIKLITLSGQAGTGKTLLAIAAGLSKVTDEDEYHKLLVSRPIFPLGKDLGFLPGDLEEKLNPWMQPIFDNLELLLNGGVVSRHKRMSKSYQELIDQGMLAVEPLTYIRGRSLPNQFFIVDEAQNLTVHEIKTILTRAGENTKVVFTGDPNQIDNPYLDSQNNGLSYVLKRFKKEKIAAHISLQRGERSELATIAAALL